MRKLTVLLTAATFTLTGLTGAFASEFTKGIVKKIDAKGKKVTIIHEELKSLEMPAMTMVFRTMDDAMLERMKEGEQIEFIADRVNGKLTVTEIR